MIYADNNATSALDPVVREAMWPYWTERFFNPSSPYTPARGVSLAVTAAHEQVAALLDAHEDEVVLTSGGTEANATAVHLARMWNPARRHWICSAVEHASVIEALRALEAEGHRVSWIPVDREGRLDLDFFRAALTPDTALVSVMLANNETGVLHPIKEMAEFAREVGVPVHVDAAQAVGRIPVSFRDLNVHFLTCSAHKMHGPKGAGALMVQHGVPRNPLFVGGGQENGWRAGTENVPALVGLGAAADAARAVLASASAQMRRLRDRVERAVREALPDCVVVGAGVERLPNTSLLLIPGIHTDVMLAQLDLSDVCCSSGSACASGSSEPSHVLRAMGWAGVANAAAVRVSWGRFNTDDEANSLVNILVDDVKAVRMRLR